MYNSKSINDGLQFINQSNTRTTKTCNKLKNNKYKNKNNKNFVLDNDAELIENFVVDDGALTAKNINETNKMNTNIVGYNSSMNELNNIQNSITKQAKIFLDINKKSDDSSLRNKDVQITDGKFGRVNNAGLFKLYPSGATKCGIPVVPKSVGFDLSGKSAAEYSVLEDAAGNLALYGTDMVQGPNGTYPCSDYSGTNVYVSKPISFNYDTNMVYVGVYNQDAANAATVAGQLVVQNDLSNSTVKQCVTRAMDKGMSFASLSNYNSTSKTGQCYVGNYLLNGGSSNAYRTIQRATIFTITDTAHDAFTFAADGGLYSGTSGAGGNAFISPLVKAEGTTKVPVAILSPKYGGTISELTANYAQGQVWTNWNNLVNFNNSIIGTPGGSLDTAKQYSYWYPIMRTYSYQYNGNTYSYQQQDWEIRTYTSTVSWPPNGQLNISYRCGNKSMQSFSRQVSLGENGFTVNCWELYEQYPSFSLNLSDDGTITIVNNKTPNDILYTSTNQISNQPETQMISIAGANKTMMPWADRPDWVSGSVNGGGLLTSYSMGAKTLTNGQYISSPSGKCRLIFNKSGGTAGTLVLEYSVYNVSQTQGAASSQGLDKDNNLIGNSNNYSQYYLTKVDDPNIKGKIAYIDINNGLHEYSRDMIEFDNDYIQAKGFAPYSITGTILPNTTEALCKTSCNNDPSCAGYTYNDSVCKRYRDTEIYPKGDRILDDSKTTYIRKKKISATNTTDFSCNKFVNDVDSSVYSSYPRTDPNPMTSTQKCALGLILEPRMGVLQTKNSAAVTKGNEIKGYINGIYTNQNNLKDTINTKSKDIEKGIAGQEAVKKQIDKYEESNITNTATVSDTELLLVSDNYKYVLWSIVTVIAGIAAIKSFRTASE
jgi:hypothetical protein